MATMTLINLNMLYMRARGLVERERHVPLGCLYLTSALERAGHDVDFRDFQMAEYTDMFARESILDFLSDPAPILGVSCMANLLPFALWALKDFKQKYPDVTVVMGGVGPTAVESEILETFDWIDIIVRGEAEISGPLLMNALENNRPLETVPGISFMRNGKRARTDPAPRIDHLDSLDYPAYHKIDLSRYTGYGMITTRGCPFPCTFCSVMPFWGRNPKYRSLDNIIDEMRYLHENFGVDLFLFQDEYFISTPERCSAFCARLRKSGLRVRWKCFGRINLTTRGMMEEMARSGCIELRFGLESGSEKVLARTRKGFTPEQSIPVVSQAVRLFPGVDAFYVWGFPFETMADFSQTIFQMITFRMMGVRVLPSLLSLLPQTQIYRDYIDSYELEFCRELFPEYMVTGHELRHSSRVSIESRYMEIFEFIRCHPRIFPGFFHIDLENNILPKFSVLEEFGFYVPRDEISSESCGAHSPRLTTSPVPA